MSFRSVIPEDRLATAQDSYDKAVGEQMLAESAAREKDRLVVSAREALEQAKREVAAAIPVDRSAVQLSGGGAVTEDHRQIGPSGMQKGYIVLAPDELARGFVRPLRDAYRHQKCGKITTMSRDIAATYARDPFFYNGTFCTTCRGHFPIGEDGEFTWYENDGSDGPKVGT